MACSVRALPLATPCAFHLTRQRKLLPLRIDQQNAIATIARAFGFGLVGFVGVGVRVHTYAGTFTRACRSLARDRMQIYM
jgi:hypothetical protein